MTLADCFIPLTAYVKSIDQGLGRTPEALTETLDAQIEQARMRALNAGMDPDRFQEALFPVLAWVDEHIARSGVLQQGHAWQPHLLQRRYFKTSLAGQEFFQRLEQLQAGDTALREVFLLCLCLGFQGRHSLASNAAELTNIRIEQYRLLKQHDRSYAAAGTELFPEAYGHGGKPQTRGAGLFGHWSWQRVLFIVLPPLILLAVGVAMHAELTQAVRHFREAINL